MFLPLKVHFMCYMQSNAEKCGGMWRNVQQCKGMRRNAEKCGVMQRLCRVLHFLPCKSSSTGLTPSQSALQVENAEKCGGMWRNGVECRVMQSIEASGSLSHYCKCQYSKSRVSCSHLLRRHYSAETYSAETLFCCEGTTLQSTPCM